MIIIILNLLILLSDKLSEVHSIHRDRIGELRERLILLQQESDRIARDFVRLHGLRTAIATPGADLVERVEQLISRHEADIIRTDLYLADEVFMTGTAAEVTPVRAIDDHEIGPPGPVTKAIQSTFFDVVRGRDERWTRWLEYAAKAPAGS